MLIDNNDKIYDYFNSVVSDVIDYLKENNLDKKPELIDTDELYDELINNDSVTGNASGSYTFNTVQAEQNLVGNWQLLDESLDELGCAVDILKEGPEWCDVAIRCYLLPDAISTAIKRLQLPF